MNNFFDIKEYGPSVVKSFLDDSLFWHVEVERQKKANFYIMRANAQMYDDLFQLNEAKEVEFVTVQN